MGGSSSQPRTNSAMSPINAFLIEDLYTPEFSESLQENIGYWQEPNPHEYPIAWTTEEEIMLAKGWVAISEKSKHGNARKQDGFWCETVRLPLIHFYGVYGNVMCMAQESGAGDKDYVQRAMIHYQAETELPFKFRHCWDVLKDSPKWKETALPNFNTGFEGGSKRHKSSGSSLFNTKSVDASIYLNTNVGDNDEDEVQEIRRPKGMDKARAARKNKGLKASGSSTINDNALARLMVTEMTAAEKEQREAFIEIKRRKVECREREVAATEYQQQQEDIRFYLQPYDHLTGD
ncbi:glutathione S-transferase T3-like protein [Tanacetum coccineum]